MTDWELLVQPLRDEVQEHGALLNLFEEQQAAILRREPDLVLTVAGCHYKTIGTHPKLPAMPKRSGARGRHRRWAPGGCVVDPIDPVFSRDRLALAPRVGQRGQSAR